ncbi:hypothetical protein [Pseudomonas fragi]|uniref:hypothetical protein n=2 Tax=Pseudomonas TaxID=286 RepID=UPI002953E322|nr:hypothetical protein [Pseudomonas fragi]WOL26737.1 hypothetical protein Q1A94_17435 [Pseudomonas fragi]
MLKLAESVNFQTVRGFVVGKTSGSFCICFSRQLFDERLQVARVLSGERRPTHYVKGGNELKAAPAQ